MDEKFVLSTDLALGVVKTVVPLAVLARRSHTCCVVSNFSVVVVIRYPGAQSKLQRFYGIG